MLGHKKHLLDVQYRMHPSISLFPNREFYDKQISDAPNVKEIDYEKRFLQGNMYSSYSFISVVHGKEEFGLGHSPKNMVEAAVVSEIVDNLFKRMFYCLLVLSYYPEEKKNAFRKVIDKLYEFL
jgi:superfamily I DNA and/or RNA helicase